MVLSELESGICIFFLNFSILSCILLLLLKSVYHNNIIYILNDNINIICKKSALLK